MVSGAVSVAVCTVPVVMLDWIGGSSIGLAKAVKLSWSLCDIGEREGRVFALFIVGSGRVGVDGLGSGEIYLPYSHECRYQGSKYCLVSLCLRGVW